MTRQKHDSDVCVTINLGPEEGGACIDVEAWRMAAIIGVGENNHYCVATMSVDELDVLISALQTVRKTIVCNGAEE